jgi:hypothetical protein
VVIYLSPAPGVAAVTLEDYFEYDAPTPPPPATLIQLIITLLLMLLGFFAPGDGPPPVIPPSSGGGGGGPCFIATAAYGTPMASEIDTLRAVRDTFLLESTVGTAFVDAYYSYSPVVADVVAQSPVLASIVRVLLVPVIFLGKVALVMPTLTALVGMSLGAAFMLRRRGRRKA